MNVKKKIQKCILPDQILNKKDLVLNDFVENEGLFNNLIYKIKYTEHLKIELKSKESEFLIFDGHQTTISHFIKGKRFFGNSKLIECSPLEIVNKTYQRRLIRINTSYYFIDAMLFVQAGSKTFKLRDSNGFFQLHIPQKQTIKIS